MTIRYDTYARARAKIKTGDLLSWSQREKPFSSWHNFQVWCVRLFQMSEYDHVGMAYWGDDDRLYVVEAVVPRPRKVLLSENLPVYHTGVKLHWTTAGIALMCDYIYNPKYEYGKWEAVKAFFGKNNRKNFKTECAELVNSIYRCCGLRLDCRDTPSELTRAVQELGGATTLLLKEDQYEQALGDTGCTA